VSIDSFKHGIAPAPTTKVLCDRRTIVTRSNIHCFLLSTFCCFSGRWRYLKVHFVNYKCRMSVRLDSSVMGHYVVWSIGLDRWPFDLHTACVFMWCVKNAHSTPHDTVSGSQDRQRSGDVGVWSLDVYALLIRWPQLKLA